MKKSIFAQSHGEMWREYKIARSQGAARDLVRKKLCEPL